MPWLVVLGFAAWKPDREHHFRAGVHEVSEELAEQARRAGIRSLLVLDEEPIIEQPEEGPLTLDHLKRGRGGVRLAQPELEPESEPFAPPREHRCLHCGEEFPHKGPLARHIEKHHPANPEPETESSSP